MPSITTMLVDFLMDLFRDPDKAAEFRDDPEGVLEAAGLGGVCGRDVDAVRPVILDFAPVSVDSSFDREYNTGRNEASNSDNNPFNPVFGGNNNDDDNGGGRGRDNDNGRDHDHDHDSDHDNGRDWDDHGHAVQQLTHILNHYSYTSEVDDRDTIVDQSVNQNIWADGDVEQYFDNDAVIASGDDSVAAGDDANVANGDDSIAAGGDVDQDNSEDNSTNIDVDGDADIEIGSDDTTVKDSFNEDNDGIDVDGIANSVDVDKTTNEDSFNEETNLDIDKSVNDSYNPDLEVDHSINDSYNQETDLEVDNSVNDSYNPDLEVDHSINDSYNPDLEVDHSINDSLNSEFEVDNSVNDSFNPEESFNDEATTIEDNIVVVDTEVEDDSAAVVAD